MSASVSGITSPLRLQRPVRREAPEKLEESMLERAAQVVAESGSQTVVDVLHGRALEHYALALRQFLALRLGREGLDAAWAHLRALVALQPSAALVAAPGVRAHLFRLARSVIASRADEPTFCHPLPGFCDGVAYKDLEVLELRLVRELRPVELCCALDAPLESVLVRLQSATDAVRHRFEGTNLRAALVRAFDLRVDDHENDERPALGVGTMLGERYRLQLRVGSGAFGDVYRAEDAEVPGHVVALKLLHQPSYSAQARQHALRELRHIASVFHPSVVQFKDHGWYEGRLWFVMPWYEGDTLLARAEREPLTREEAHEIFVPLARGLCAMHAAGLRHQDIKPDNVLLAQLPAEGGVLPVLLDLGVAATDAEMLVAGTPTYFAPEVAAQFAPDFRKDGTPMERPWVSAKADVFSLALTLRNALEPEGEDDIPAGANEAFIERRACEPVDGPVRREHRDLRKDFARWLHPDPSKRPSAEALIGELEALLRPQQKRALRRRRLRWTVPILLIASAVFGAAVTHYETLRQRSGALLDETRQTLASTDAERAGLAREVDALAVTRTELESRLSESEEGLGALEQTRRALAAELSRTRAGHEARENTLSAQLRDEHAALEAAQEAHALGQSALQEEREARRREQALRRDDASRAAAQEHSLRETLRAERARGDDAESAATRLETQLESTRAQLAGAEEHRRTLERALQVQVEARRHAELALERARRAEPSEPLSEPAESEAAPPAPATPDAP